MKDNFADSLSAVLVHEGGYVDHPEDPGGATNKGVTLAVFRDFYGDMGKDDLRAITDEQVGHVYKTGYWDKCRCDDLPAGVDYVVFDQAVNSGPGRSAKWLQTVLGVTVDGDIGPQTLGAVTDVSGKGAQDITAVINKMCDVRLEFLKQLSTWKTFGRGWQSRVDSVRAHGLQLVVPPPKQAYGTYQEGYEAGQQDERGRWAWPCECGGWHSWMFLAREGHRKREANDDN